MDQQYELTQIAQEYGSGGFFKKLALNNELSELWITTLEDKSYRIQVSVDGWHLLASDQFFPTFESLANEISPKFQRKWLLKLSEKLQTL
ncbi:hypothetical protein OGAPHI_002612 [Ogataea philodendri]|uniref:GSKIP domain-containing protein n=1 Tax=Ogataea philodendri TaxID=1378263 RepID=A0A9P8PBL7_9ASCO|nr:uncharacterized protein OGAPHI_002612 [Ogataea philodendri]KAH3668857.1 hypothetical protein OGAPHI_002612 [Ogataea philodendri]